jgi:hypothetical protein
VIFRVLLYTPAAMKGGTLRLTFELMRNEPPPPPAAADPRLTADTPVPPGTGVLAPGWVTSVRTHVAGVVIAHTTLGFTSRKLVAGMVLSMG